MSQRTYRVLLVVALVAVALAVLRLVLALDDQEIETAETDEQAFSVTDAMNQSRTDVAVRGYVYDDGSFLQLCAGLVPGSPPRCLGPSLFLRGLDLARLDLEEGDVDGTEVLWTERPVVLTGELDGGALDVRDILSG